MPCGQIMARHGLSREIAKINGRIKEIGDIKETYKIESSSADIWSASSVDAADVDGYAAIVAILFCLTY